MSSEACALKETSTAGKTGVPTNRRQDTAAADDRERSMPMLQDAWDNALHT
jgi:hypothetical protein